MLVVFREQTFLKDILQKVKRILNNKIGYFRANDKILAEILSPFHLGMSF